MTVVSLLVPLRYLLICCALYSLWNGVKAGGDSTSAVFFEDLLQNSENHGWNTLTAMKDLKPNAMLDTTEDILFKRVKGHLEFSGRKGLLVDVGANRGLFSKLMHTLWPDDKQILVEAIPYFANELRRAFPNVEVYNRAITDGTGPQVVKMKGAPAWQSDKSFHTGASLLNRGAEYSKDLFEVNASSLDQLFPTEHIKVLKIDTEGMDGRCMRGADKLLRDKRVDCIYWENNKLQSQVGDSLYGNVQHLCNLGYMSLAVGGEGHLYLLNGLASSHKFFEAQASTGNIFSLQVNLIAELKSDASLESFTQQISKCAQSDLPGTDKLFTTQDTFEDKQHHVTQHVAPYMKNVSKEVKTPKHPYSVWKLEWGDCTPRNHLKSPTLLDVSTKSRWLVTLSSDTNGNYLPFLPSAIDHWRALGLEPIVALIAETTENVDGIVEGIRRFGVDLKVFRSPDDASIPKGHAAKLARAFLATQYGDDLVTIVDIDYYFFWFDQWSAHMNCIPEDAVFGLGYNRYSGGKDEGKWPMYLSTARSSTFAKFLNARGEINFTKWISDFRHIQMYDKNESPYQKYGEFSDESLFRALISKSDVEVIWVNTPGNWKRISRVYKVPITPKICCAEIADVFPNRPLDDCNTYLSRTYRIHEALGIANMSRDIEFVRYLRSVGVKTREWGRSVSTELSSMDDCERKAAQPILNGDHLFTPPSKVAPRQATGVHGVRNSHRGHQARNRRIHNHPREYSQ